jgi:hypothetical protein
MNNSTCLPLAYALPQSLAVKAYRRLFQLMSFLILASFTLVSNHSWAHEKPTGPTITSDRSDYQPGDTLRLSGSGWQPEKL